ncbi:MAG TPA: hypothetical protein VF522_04215 [Ramlibacter sp.]|uniref:hypothetical protein n=1 Tax=Ramlibacter sp. TaxID=1917967 RepID=UPI002ECFF6CF
MQEQFWRDGYTVVKGLFTREEVQRWRQRALERNSKADLLSDPVLSEVVLHPGLLHVIREILGGQPLYFCNSYSVVGIDRIGGFHKDNSDRYVAAAPDWQTDRYPVIQFCLYCQPHGELPEGLDILEGSHFFPNYRVGTHVSPAVEIGDVVVFNSRTSHSANSFILRGLNYRVRPNGLLWRLLVRLPRPVAEAIRQKHPQQRVMIGGVYGLDHPLTHRQIEYLNQRIFGADCVRASSWSSEIRKLATERGLKLVPPEDRRIRDVTHEQHFEMPY